MKIGIEHRKRTLAGILILAAFLVLESGRFEWADPLNSRLERLRPAVAEPGNIKDGPWLDPTLHYPQLKLAENRVYKGTGRNIFRSDNPIHQNRTARPAVPPRSSRIVEPVVPQVTLRFFGFASLLNQPPKAFLGDGDSLFVAKEGDIVNRRYRVLRIDENSVVLEDLIERSVHELALHS